MQLARWVSIIALAAACTRGSASAGKEDRVTTFDVKTTADLQRLGPEYGRLARQGYSGRIDIRIAANAALSLTSWSLAPEVGARRDVPIDVVITGSGGSLPLFQAIVARSLVVDGVAFTDGKHASVRVARDVTLRRVSVVDGRRVNPATGGVREPTQGLLEIEAGGEVAIEDAWFVRNYQDERADRLVRIVGSPARVRVVRSAFLGNAFETELWVEHARSVDVEDSVFYRSWPGGGEQLTCEECGEVDVAGSSFVTPARGAFAHHGELAKTVTSLTAKPVRVPAPETWTSVRALFPR